MTHAQKRLKQRYRLHPTKVVMNKIHGRIVSKCRKAKLIRRGRGKSKIYKVKICNRWVIAVFNWKYRQIVTFLPKGAI